MTVKQILIKYHAVVPFPWSPAKISKAGYVPEELIRNIAHELEQCKGSEDPLIAAITAMMHKS